MMLPRARGLPVTGVMLLIAVAGQTTVQAAPAQLRGKAVVVSWNEERHERTVETKQERHINSPFRMTVYVSEKDQVFNRLTAGNGGMSDQAAGSRDRTRFAPRAVNFSGTRMTVSNTFITGGARQITANFDSSFNSCSVLGRSGGGPIRQKKMGGPDVDLLSATAGSASCSVSAGKSVRPVNVRCSPPRHRPVLHRTSARGFERKC